MTYQETSREAWQSMVPVTADLDRAICRELAKAGNAGLTDYEIEQRIERAHQSVSANRRHLVERGVVKDTCLRGVTKSGRKAIRWVLAEFYDPLIHAQQSVPVTKDGETVGTADNFRRTEQGDVVADISFNGEKLGDVVQLELFNR